MGAAAADTAGVRLTKGLCGAAVAWGCAVGLFAALSGCALPASSVAASSPVESLPVVSETAGWDPGRYLERFTRPLPSVESVPPSVLLAVGPWDPARYLERYTWGTAPDAAPLRPYQLWSPGPWDPGRYLERYTR